jgi:CcmD family protein
MDNLWFLFAAYLIVWLAIWGYTIRLGRKQRQLSVELEHLRTLLDERERHKENGPLGTVQGERHNTEEGEPP